MIGSGGEKRPSTTARLLEEEQKELAMSLPAATINALKHAKVPGDHRRRINTEEKAKVVPAAWETEFIK